MTPTARKTDDIEPEDFLRALLHISPEDAEKVREDAAKIMEHEDRDRAKQEGPTADYGKDA
jgi:hypothetical protein